MGLKSIEVNKITKKS